MGEINPVVERAIKLSGGLSALARQLSVKPPTVWQWLKKKRPVPSSRCIPIQRATNGAITCCELRPDVFGNSHGPISFPSGQDNRCNG